MSSPFVYWSQKEDSISMRIELKLTKPPEIQLDDNEIVFRALVDKSNKPTEYKFNLRFFDSVLPNSLSQTQNGRQIELFVAKRKANIWPRLTKCTLRRHWLRVDFNRYSLDQSEDEFDEFSESEIEYDLKSARNPSFIDRLGENRILNDNKISKSWEQEPKSPVEKMRLIYLFLFNFIQFLGYLTILSVFMLHYSKDQTESFGKMYQRLGGLFKFLSWIRLLQFLHVVLGFHSGEWLTTFFLAIYRLFVVYILIDVNTKLQQRPVVVFYLLINSLCDVTSSLFYSFKACNVNWSTLTWLRCTLWVPCYPLLFLLEGLLFLRSLPIYSQSDLYSIHLPNQLNFSFQMSFFLKLYLFGALIPVMYFSMNKLYSYRLTQLS